MRSLSGQIGVTMTCKEMNKLIPSFLNDELSGRELKGFVEHISSCDECREELSIQYLVAEGMARLENGKSFDLQSELLKKLEIEKRRMRMKNGIQLFVYGMEILAIITIITIIFMVIIL